MNIDFNYLSSAIGVVSIQCMNFYIMAKKCKDIIGLIKPGEDRICGPKRLKI